MKTEVDALTAKKDRLYREVRKLKEAVDEAETIKPLHKTCNQATGADNEEHTFLFTINYRGAIMMLYHFRDVWRCINEF